MDDVDRFLDEMTDPTREWKSEVERVLDRECLTDAGALDYLRSIVESTQNQAVRWTLDGVQGTHVLTLYTPGPDGRFTSQSPTLSLAVRSVLFAFFTSRGVFDYHPGGEDAEALVEPA